MTGLLLLFLPLAIGWSLIAWGLYRLLADGGATLVAITRWLELEPATTQWFADSLAAAGSPGRGLMLAIWAAGLLVLAGLAWLATPRRRS
jgi:hypothetical protein